jgi:hypothetical protein
MPYVLFVNPYLHVLFVNPYLQRLRRSRSQPTGLGCSPRVSHATFDRAPHGAREGEQQIGIASPSLHCLNLVVL